MAFLLLVLIRYFISFFRYEREVNNGHRSALKKILEGDAHPSSPLVLCISSIHLRRNSEPDTNVFSTSNAAESSTVASVELTDGWYREFKIVNFILCFL